MGRGDGKDWMSRRARMMGDFLAHMWWQRWGDDDVGGLARVERDGEEGYGGVGGVFLINFVILVKLGKYVILDYMRNTPNVYNIHS